MAFFTLVLILVSALWIYAMRRQPERDNAGRQEKAWIIGGGIILPSVSILVLLLVSIPVGNLMSTLPTAADDALQIRVTAHQWWWQIDYPGGDAENTLATSQNIVHMPADVPVHLYLTSADVIHSFWVPRLAGKLDMIPGRINELQIQADEPGIYRGVCAEFCGLAHASMRFEVHVHSREDFARWLADAQRQQSGNAQSRAEDIPGE